MQSAILKNTTFRHFSKKLPLIFESFIPKYYKFYLLLKHEKNMFIYPRCYPFPFL